jgi:hypothetical protein
MWLQIMLESFYKWYNFWQLEVEHKMEGEKIKMPKARVELL